jgi:multidrug resistance efflux pump
VQSSQQPTPDNRTESKRKTAQPETSDSNTSVTVAKKLMEKAKLSYERMKTLADKHVVPAADLEMAKLEYDVQAAHYEHALRTLKYAQLEVQLAETELQEAASRPRTTGGSTDDGFEVKKLKIKLEMAKLKASDLE